MIRILGIATLLMVVSLLYRKMGGNLDFMNISLLDGWSLSHVLLYVFAGYRYPEKAGLLLLVGFTWEMIEYVGENAGVKFVKFKPTDPLYNAIGLAIGTSLSRRR